MILFTILNILFVFITAASTYLFPELVIMTLWAWFSVEHTDTSHCNLCYLVLQFEDKQGELGSTKEALQHSLKTSSICTLKEMVI